MSTTAPDPTSLFLSLLGSDLRAAAHRQQRKHRQRFIAITAIAGSALLAGGAFAATQTLWSGTDMTAADIARQATTVVNDTWSDCDQDGHCTTTTGTHTQVIINPAMGVTFVLPDGRFVYIVPAAPMSPGLPSDSVGTLKTTKDASGHWTGGTWTVDLPGDGQRTIVWHQADGSIVAIDDRAGKTTTTVFHAGDVVPLIPGSLGSQARTLDKAVTFDLPNSGGPVIIFPSLNETYVGAVGKPGDPPAEPLPAGGAAKYGLTPVGEYDGTLPVTAAGGTWTLQLPDGTTRTISWRAGEAMVTITDRLQDGTVQVTDVPIGHQLPLIPFK